MYALWQIHSLQCSLDSIFPSDEGLKLPVLALPATMHWVTLHKPKEKFAGSLSVIAVTKKVTVRTPKDPDHYLGSGRSWACGCGVTA